MAAANSVGVGGDCSCCGRRRQWVRLGVTGSGRSGPWRPGEDGAGGILHASNGCRCEVVGAPLLSSSTTVLGRCRLTGSGVAVESGSRLLPWPGACGRLGATPGESLHLRMSVVMVAAPLGCRFSLLGASLRGTRLLQHRDLGVKTLSIYGHVTVVPLASCPPWRRRIGSPSRVVALVAMVGWWRCSCAAADEVRMVRVGGEVQRGHGGWQPWAGVHGAVVILVMAWRRRCSQCSFSDKDPWSSV